MSKIDLGVALVTGASSGIGQATAQALERAGCRVFGTSRRAVRETSDSITMLICDVTNDASDIQWLRPVSLRQVHQKTTKPLHDTNGTQREQ